MSGKKIKAKNRPLFSQVVYYVRSDIRAAFGYFLLNVTVVSIAAAYLLVFGFVAIVVNAEMRKIIDQPGSGTRIKAVCTETSRLNEKSRFTEERVKEVKNGEPRITVAYESIQLGASLSIGGRDAKPYYLEGITTDDPRLARANIWRGIGLSANNAEEIILTDQALINLRGKKSENKTLKGDLPEFVELSLSRQANGQSQPLVKKYRLADILVSDKPAAYLPLEQIRQLENWAANYLTDLAVDGQAPAPVDLVMDAARVFVDSATSPAQLEETLKYYGVKLEEFGSYKEYSAKGQAQIRVSRNDGADLNLSDLPSAVSQRKDLKFELVAEDVAISNGQNQPAPVVLALAPTDFRLKDIKVSGKTTALKIIEKVGHVVISRRYAEALKLTETDQSQALIFSDQELVYSLISDGLTEDRLGDFFFDVLCSLETLGYMKYRPEIQPACLVAVNNQAAIEALRSQPFTQRPKIWQNPESMMPELIDGGVGRMVSGDSVVIAGRDGKMSLFDPRHCQALALVFGTKAELAPVLEKIPDKELRVAEVYLLAKANFSALSFKTKVAFASQKEIQLLPFDWAKQYEVIDPGFILVDPKSRADSPVKLGEIKLTALKARDYPFPEDLAFVDWRTLNKLSLWECFSQAERQAGQRSLIKKVDIIFDEIKNYPQVTEQLIAAGLKVESLSSVETRPIVGYRVRSVQENAGKIGKKTLGLLKSNKIFLDTCPDLNFSAKIEGLIPEKAVVNFAASHQNDPLENCVALKAGAWLADDKRNFIIVPETILADYPFKPGQGVQLIFERGNEPPITLECFIIGIASGSQGYVTSDLAANIYLWLTGQLVYSAGSGKFLQPGNIPQTTGHSAANIYVGSLDDVKPVVEYLQGLGYQTPENSLQAQADMRKLKQILGFLVTILAIGTCFSAMAEVIFTTLMNTRTKIYETAGILRALGGTQKLIRQIFMIKGVIMGISAFILAVIFAVLGLWLIKICLLNLSLGQRVAQLNEYPFFGKDTLWFFAAVFVFCLLLCHIGVRWSARLAGKTGIAQALHSRE